MTVPARHLDRLRAERLHALVCKRLEACAAAPALAQDYLRLVRALPQQLRHNGLRLTLAYLRLLAAEQGRDSQAARDLIADWLDSPDGTHQGWHLQGFLEAGRIPAHLPNQVAHYRTASRLALREADWLCRFVQSESDALAARHLRGAPSGNSTYAQHVDAP